MAIARSHRSILRRASDVLVVFGVIALIVNLLLALVVTNPVGATDVPPTLVEGNPTCAFIGQGSIEFKLDSPTDGTHDDQVRALSVTITGLTESGGISFDWSSNIGVDAVIVKGGPNANVYFYTSESLGHTGLEAPPNPGGQDPSISHISFCYDVDAAAKQCQIAAAPGRIIEILPSAWALRADKVDQQSFGPHVLTTDIPAGTYDIILASWDDHSSKKFQFQPQEQWVLEGRTDGGAAVFTSSAIADLPDDKDYLEQTVKFGVVFGDPVGQLFAHHAFPGGTNPNSVDPICVAFDPIQPTPTNTPVPPTPTDTPVPPTPTDTPVPPTPTDTPVPPTPTDTPVPPTPTDTPVPPTATPTPLPGCGIDGVTLSSDAPKTFPITVVNFTATLFTNLDFVGPAEYQWDFDNNGTVDDTTAGNTNSFDYGGVGSFTAKVTVVDTGFKGEGECSASDTDPAVVNPQDTPTPTATPTDTPTATPTSPPSTATPTPEPTSTVLGVVVLPGTGFGPPSPVSLSFGLRMLGSALMILTGVGLRRLGT